MRDIALDNREAAFMEADLHLVEVYASWYGIGCHEDIPEAVQDLILLHMRSAFLTGRIQGQEDLVPVVDTYAQGMREIVSTLKAV